MFRFRAAIITPIFAILLFSGSTLAQVAPAKIVLINTAAFSDDKAGITKLVNANNQIDKEFAAQIKALQDEAAKIQSIAGEIANLQKTNADYKVIAAKGEEGSTLERQFGYKKTDLETAINKRRQTVIGPISEDIGKALVEFGKKNGYTAIFDIVKMVDSGALLFLADNAEVTKEFVTFYNTRSAVAATVR